MSQDGGHPAFKRPKDPQVRIWRYMDFTKFVSTLENGGLFFPRADRLGDPFEGTFTVSNRQALRHALLRDGLPDERVRKVTESDVKLRRWVRRWMMISCWHMNEHESAAMWKLYARTNEAICIQSTFERLRQCLDNQVYIGEVHYIDYEAEWIPENNLFYPFLHKRKSFEHERELRAVKWLVPKGEHGLDWEAGAPEGGVCEQVNLSHLIEVIYVAPTSPKWFLELVVRVTKKYGLDKNIIQSSLDREPIY